VRWPAVILGVVLVAFAFAAATRVTDTREGLIAEVVTLLGGRRSEPAALSPCRAKGELDPEVRSAGDAVSRLSKPRSRNDVLLGAAASRSRSSSWAASR